MRATERLALCATALVVVAVAAAAPAAARALDAVDPVSPCQQELPAATDGVLTLDTPTVPAGSQALGVVSDVAQWPQRLVGGGSGETFVSCTPWSPLSSAEVMTSEDAGLFLLDVPAGTPAGSYPVSLVFYQGSVDPFSGGTLVRLGTTLTVAAGPVPVVSTGAACALPGGQALEGELTGDASVAAGGTASLSLVGVGDRVWFNEYDSLWFVACLDGVATPILQDVAGVPTFALAVPAGTSPGVHTVRLWGVLDGTRWWEHTIVVTAPSAGVRDLAITGTSAAPAAAVASLLVLGGLVVVVAARRRATG